MLDRGLLCTDPRLSVTPCRHELIEVQLIEYITADALRVNKLALTPASAAIIARPSPRRLLDPLIDYPIPYLVYTFRMHSRIATLSRTVVWGGLETQLGRNYHIVSACMCYCLFGINEFLVRQQIKVTS